MQKEYWFEKWEKNDIGFHREKVNEYLEKYFPSELAGKNLNALVPLCGKSRDLVWLAGQGLHVVGCELSEKACEQFFNEHNLAVSKTINPKFISFTAEDAPITINCGDFFDLTKAELGKIDLCYDRGALVALPADLRKKYAQQITNLLDVNAYYLLIVLNYTSEDLIGPPFAISENEISHLFGKSFSIKLLETKSEPIETVATLAKKNASNLINQAYLLRKA